MNEQQPSRLTDPTDRGATTIGNVPSGPNSETSIRYDQVRDDSEARDRFGGLNVGAAFFGWLVTIAITVLLISIIGAVLVAVGSTTSITQSDAQRSAGTIGIVAGIVLLVVFAVAYYTGGYVAGRMCRFQGARQGFGVWLIGLIIALVAIAAGAIFGTQYNILDRVNLPRIPISTDHAGVGGLITAVAVILLSLAAAMIGGLAGHRYHTKVDQAAHI